MNCREITLMLGLGIGAILLTTQQMHGQEQAGERTSANCAARSQIVGQLAQKYGESRQMIALTFARQVIELFASPETGSWTLTITFPSGETCLIGAGDMIELGPDMAPAGDPA